MKVVNSNNCGLVNDLTLRENIKALKSNKDC